MGGKRRVFGQVGRASTVICILNRTIKLALAEKKCVWAKAGCCHRRCCRHHRSSSRCVHGPPGPCSGPSFLCTLVESWHSCPSRHRWCAARRCAHPAPAALSSPPCPERRRQFLCFWFWYWMGIAQLVCLWADDLGLRWAMRLDGGKGGEGKEASDTSVGDA